MEILIDRALEISSTLLAGLVGFYWKSQQAQTDEIEQRLREIELQVARLDERTPKNAL